MLDATNQVTNPEGWRDLDPIGIAVHHTVTRMSIDSTIDQELAHIRAIDAYHVSQGFGGFGYHVIIFPSGRAYKAGDFTRARAHVKDRNHQLLGIAFVGDFTAESPSPLAIRAFGPVLNELDPQRRLDVMGHNDWAIEGWGTECPGRLSGVDFRRLADSPDTPEWAPSIQQVAHALHFAYTSYYEGRKEIMVGTDRQVLGFLDRWLHTPDLPWNP